MSIMHLLNSILRPNNAEMQVLRRRIEESDAAHPKKMKQLEALSQQLIDEAEKSERRVREHR